VNFSWQSLDRADKRMFALFAALTLWTPAGILIAAFSLSSGANREWPPDDLREAIGFWSAVGMFVLLLIGTVWAACLQGGISGGPRPLGQKISAPHDDSPVA
jgi:hypothetical protein